MSVHPFQQWITYIYKYTCTGYAYIIDKKVHPYRHPYRQRVGQVVMKCCLMSSDVS